MEDEDYSLKVILVGAAGVGKTSLVNCYFALDNATDTNPTVAPAFCAVKMRLDDKRQVELHVWDTAGQEKYQATNRSFYRGAHIAFVCYDSQAVSIISEWIARVRQEAPHCAIFLVATKLDLLSPADEAALRDESKSVQQNVGAVGCWFTSAQTGIGVRELFIASAQRAQEEFAPHFAQTMLSLDADGRRRKRIGACNC
jgi:small GTP-binding protein